jgi:hypothetical protein
MYAVTIINGAGDVREWAVGCRKHCEALAATLPANGWSLCRFIRWDGERWVEA